MLEKRDKRAEQHYVAGVFLDSSLVAIPPKPETPMPDHLEAPQTHRIRMQNILAWIRTAKENLPAISRGAVSTDRVVAMSALLDRLHVEAVRRQRAMDPGAANPGSSTAGEKDPRRRAA
jgi:hypothetical protein